MIPSRNWRRGGPSPGRPAVNLLARLPGLPSPAGPPAQRQSANGWSPYSSHAHDPDIRVMRKLPANFVPVAAE